MGSATPDNFFLLLGHSDGLTISIEYSIGGITWYSVYDAEYQY